MPYVILCQAAAAQPLKPRERERRRGRRRWKVDVVAAAREFDLAEKEREKGHTVQNDLKIPKNLTFCHGGKTFVCT